MLNFFELIPRALEDGQPFALGIISGIKGSSPQKKGAKAIFFADGRILGTMGGGCLEAEIQDRARRALSTGEPATFDLVLDHDFGWDDGLICGGKVSGMILPRAAESATMWRQLIERNETLVWGVKEDFSMGLIDVSAEAGSEWLYREMVSPPWQLWVAGSGHVAQAVTPLAQSLDFEVTVFDDRPSLANRKFFPDSTRFRVDYWETLLRDPTPERPTMGLIVTRGHQHDAMVLKNWVQRSLCFLGMIGSQRKKRIIFEKFLEDGLATREQLDGVFCPVGLSIHAVSVPEIAVSIAAQLVQQRAELIETMTQGAQASSASIPFMGAVDEGV
jgi:xanthine dehydrogenase accessory factor